MVQILDIVLANKAYQYNKFFKDASEQYIRFETDAFSPLM
jgi:hypothetical protein